MNIIDGKYVAENLLGKLLDKHNNLKKYMEDLQDL